MTATLASAKPAINCPNCNSLDTCLVPTTYNNDRSVLYCRTCAHVSRLDAPREPGLLSRLAIKYLRARGLWI